MGMPIPHGADDADDADGSGGSTGPGGPASPRPVADDTPPAGSALSPAELNELIASFRPDAVRVARRLVRTQAEAEDLAQTALMNVIARSHAISDPSFVKPYLMTSVRNLWKNQIRSSKRCQPARDETLFDRIPDPTVFDEPSYSEVDAAMVRRAMDSLSQQNLDLLQLRYVEHLDYAAIGERLGISAPTARQRVHRATEQLRSACFSADSDQTARRVCHLTKVRLARYARGVLAGRVAERVTDHLRSCDDCMHSYEQLLDVLDLPLRPEFVDDADGPAAPTDSTPED